jgi:NAD(P)-dependent dehydrogenase (short-subunit alcohol dehydrogenase family)
MSGSADRLASRVVLVTGSTRGIGEAIARRCAAEGAGVVITGRTVSTGEAVAASIADAGGDAIFVRTDVTIEDEVEGAVAAAIERWGRLDGVVANAASLELGAVDGPVTELSLDSWNRLIAADLTSVFLTAKHGLKAIMRGGRPGAVLTIGSLAGVRGNIGHDAYSAAKGGVVALTRAIAAYYARYAIRCNCLSLGFVDSGSDRIATVLAGNAGYADALRDFHLGAWGRPDDVTGLAALLLSDEGAYINGACIPVDGGAEAASHMPRLNIPDIPGFPPLRERRSSRSGPDGTI